MAQKFKVLFVLQIAFMASSCAVQPKIDTSVKEKPVVSDTPVKTPNGYIPQRFHDYKYDAIPVEVLKSDSFGVAQEEDTAGWLIWGVNWPPMNWPSQTLYPAKRKVIDTPAAPAVNAITGRYPPCSTMVITKTVRPGIDLYLWFLLFLAGIISTILTQRIAEFFGIR